MTTFKKNLHTCTHHRVVPVQVSRMVDCVSTATVAAQAGKITAQLSMTTRKCSSHTATQLTPAQALQQSRCPSKSTRSTCRRGASFLPPFHPSHCFSQRQEWVLQVLGPQFLPNCVPIDDTLLSGRIVVLVASSFGLTHEKLTTACILNCLYLRVVFCL